MKNHIPRIFTLLLFACLMQPVISIASEEMEHAVRESAPIGVIIDKMREKQGITFVYGTSPSNKKVAEFMRNLAGRKLGNVELILVRKDPMGSYFVLRIR